MSDLPNRLRNSCGDIGDEAAARIEELEEELAEATRDKDYAYKTIKAMTDSRNEVIKKYNRLKKEFIDKLPLDADGNPVAPGDDLYYCGGRLRWRAIMSVEASWSGDAFNPWPFRRSYRTPERSKEAYDEQVTQEEIDRSAADHKDAARVQ